MKKTFLVLFLAASSQVFCQTGSSLTVDQIMQDPKWIGTSPSNITMAIHPIF